MKAILILLIAILIQSCSKDDDNTCSCKGVFTSIEIYPQTFYVYGTPIDCGNGSVLQVPYNEAIFVNCE